MINDLPPVIAWSVNLWESDFVPLYVRAVGFVAVIPLSSLSVGVFQKGSIAALTAGVVAPFCPVEPLTASVVVKEVLIGASLGIPLAASVGAAEMFGELFDSARGQTIAAAYAPLSDSVVSPMATYCMYRWWAVVLMSGIVGVLVQGFSQSVGTLPPGLVQEADFLGIGRLVFISASVIALGAFQAFLPIGIVFLFVELCFGLLGRALPSHSFSMEALLLKTVLGLLILTSIDHMGLLTSVASLFSGY